MNQRIYFIPGTMCNENLWSDTWNSLKDISISSLELVNLSIPSQHNMSDIVDCLAKQITDDNSFLVGFSLGGYLASVLALTEPKKVGKLLLISNMPQALPDNEIKERNRTIAWIAKHGYSGISDKRINGLIHSTAHDNKSIKDNIIAMDKTLGKDCLLNQLRVTTKRQNMMSKLAGLTMPIKYYIGDSDKLVDLTVLNDFVKNHEHISLEVVKNTGHMLPLEQPQALASLINNWIK